MNSEQTEKPGRGRRILVADDGAISRKIMERTLAQLGFEVSCVEDGAKALNHLRDATPEAVITDLNMPNLNGLELCQAIRRDSRLASMPVIVTSASEMGEDQRHKAIEAGADNFVIRTSMLQEVISALLKKIG